MSSYSAPARQSAAGRIVRSSVAIDRAYDTALDDWLSVRARTHADHPAVGDVTYAELDARVGELAPPPHVAVPARRTVDFVAVMHACVRAGSVFVPQDPREPRPPDGSDVEASEGDTVLFTSGTTGSPKPVVLSRGNFEASAIASAWNLGVAPGDRWLCVLPLHHVGGLAILWRSAIYGTTAVLHERFDPDAVLAAFQSGDVT